MFQNKIKEEKNKNSCNLAQNNYFDMRKISNDERFNTKAKTIIKKV